MDVKELAETLAKYPDLRQRVEEMIAVEKTIRRRVLKE
jgi:hypothetical protein